MRILCLLSAALGLGLGLGVDRAPAARAVEPVGVWQAAMGDFGDLQDVLVLADDDIWAAGDGIVRFDGRAWHQTLDRDRPRFHAIAGRSSDALWALGLAELDACARQSLLYAWDGSAWRAEDPGTHAPLHDLLILESGQGWAVGGYERAVIQRFDGRRWLPEDAPDIGALRAIDALAADEVWAVGDRGAIARYDGRSWEAVAAPPFAWLLGLHLRPEGSGWAVGLDWTTGAGLALAFADGAWRIDMIAETPALTDVRGLGPADAVAVGANGALLHRDGEGWREIGRTNPGGFVPWQGAAVVTSACASPARRLGRPVHEPAGGGQSALDDQLDRSRALSALAELPGQQGLVAVGGYGQVVRIDDALQWRLDFAGRRLHAIDLLSAEEGWAVGEMGPPMRWHDGAWRAAPAPAMARWLRDVVTLAPDLAWAVGERGTVMRWDGQAWTQLEPFTWLDLTQVDFAAPDEGWAIAYEPTRWEGGASDLPASWIYRWDGQAWSLAARLCDVALTDVLVESSGRAWFAAAGQEAVLGQVDGAFAWHPIWGWDAPGGRAARVGRLLRTPEGEIVASGTGLARLQDGVWRSYGRPETRWPYPYYSFPALAADPDGGFWSLSGGTVLYLHPERAPQVVHSGPIGLLDLDLTTADGRAEIWAVGDRSTLLRFQRPDGGPIPEQTPTAILPPARLHPTPTPFAVLSRVQARERVAEILERQAGGSQRITALELMSLASYRAHQQREILGYWGGDTFTDYHGERLIGCQADGSLAVWRARVEGSPICRAHLELVIDAAGGEDYLLRCYHARVAELHLPLLLQYVPRDRLPTPTPTFTPVARPLTPEPVDSLLGPCPTRTPYPTVPRPAYPGPGTPEGRGGSRG